MVALLRLEKRRSNCSVDCLWEKHLNSLEDTLEREWGSGAEGLDFITEVLHFGKCLVVWEGSGKRKECGEIIAMMLTSPSFLRLLWKKWKAERWECRRPEIQVLL
jgi:hypothetical protein